MSNSWFRMYAEFATDPKVQMMSEADQRRLTMLFCIRCSNGDVTFKDVEVAFQLRISDQEWATTKQVFMEKGFIDEGNNLLNWDKRQFISDSSAARVRRYRERQKNDLKQACNVTVTVPDTDTDTDTDTKIYNTLGKVEKPPSSRSRNQALKADALEALNFLNQKTGKTYQPTDSNLDFIICRLKEGATLTECRQIIAMKFRQWHTDEKMREYLRPATLFNKTKFAQYRGELIPVEDDE